MLAGLLLATAAVAGCLGATKDTADPVEAASTDSVDGEGPPLALTGEGCVMGGGQSVHPQEALLYGNLSDIVPDPWRVADVLEDTGPQFTYSQWPKPTAPVPEEGDTWGHYHATMVCESWTLGGETREDVVFGFVGPKVKTPGFAETSADDEYLVTVVATNDEAVLEDLQTRGVDAMHANASVERVGDQLEVSMRTAHNGEYLSIYRLNELGPIEDKRIRLWYQHERTNGTYQPIAIDVTREGGTHYGDQGEGYFHHQRTAHHWPLPGAYGHTAAVHYDGFDVSLAWGPSPNVTVEEAYEH